MLSECILRGCDERYLSYFNYISFNFFKQFWILDTTLKDLDHFLKDFFHRLNIECFIYGNANKQNALALSDFLKDKLEKTYSIKSPLLMLQLLPPRDYKLKEGKSNNFSWGFFLTFQVKNYSIFKGESYSFDYHTKYSKLCCTLLYLQCGPRKEYDVVITGLLVRIMELPCLEFLQTKVSRDQFPKRLFL